MKTYTDAEASLAADIANDVNEGMGLTRYSKLQLRAAVAYWSDIAARHATRAAALQSAVNIAACGVGLIKAVTDNYAEKPTLATKPLAAKKGLKK